jgi:hypothetical protein
VIMRFVWVGMVVKIKKDKKCGGIEGGVYRNALNVIFMGKLWVGSEELVVIMRFDGAGIMICIFFPVLIFCTMINLFIFCYFY